MYRSKCIVVYCNDIAVNIALVNIALSTLPFDRITRLGYNCAPSLKTPAE
jgi:hypothetical protein